MIKEDFRIPKTKNQNQTYFHRTFRATITAKRLLETYKRLGQWQKVAKELNVTHAYILQARKWTGIFVPTKTTGRHYGGVNSKFYKGKYIDKRGYVKVNRYHPDNNHYQNTYEHTLVMEKHLGRRLLPGEIVHHIDGDKSNNKIENLYLCNHSKHRLTEESAETLIYKLYQEGKVGFNNDTGTYFIK